MNFASSHGMSNDCPCANRTYPYKMKLLFLKMLHTMTLTESKQGLRV